MQISPSASALLDIEQHKGHFTTAWGRVSVKGRKVLALK